jgi:hypothetical protein
LSRARRRYRPTFLLRVLCVLAGVVLPVAILFLLAGLSLSLKVGLALLAVLWLATELDAVPALLERWLTGRAQVRGVRSRWFIDVEAEEQATRARLRGEVGDNPALW